MSSAPAKANGIVLNSWKEIAQYLGRGVRTVQRYEHDLGLPVRRPRGKSRSAVVALAEDLDRWLRSAPTSQVGQAKVPNDLVVTSVRHSVGEGQDLRLKCHELRSAHHQAVTTLVTNLTAMMERFQASARLQQELGEMASKAEDGLGPNGSQ